MKVRRLVLAISILVIFVLLLSATAVLGAEEKEYLKRGLEQRVTDLENLFLNLTDKLSVIEFDILSLKDFDTLLEHDLGVIKEKVFSNSNDLSILLNLTNEQNKQISYLSSELIKVRAELKDLRSKVDDSIEQNQFVIMGKVITEGRTPIQGADIRLVDDGGYYRSSTDQEGNFIINVRESGTYPLIVSEQDYLVALATNITVSSESPTLLNLVMVEGGTISGKVSYADGLFIDFATIKLFDESGILVNRIFVNPDGSYKFNAKSGTYTIALEATGGRNLSETASVIKGQTVIQNFDVFE